MTQESRSPRLIAFYLPQFHPIPENDRWWGEGFTEWTNVDRGRPQYPAHRQPHVPAELGYYDLREEAARAAQRQLAQQYGIYGFCYYYYWFAGKRLLEQPVERMLAGGEPQLPFCLCWANENWTRRWDGKDREVLIAQAHSQQDNLGIIRDLARHFRDPRYIRVGGRPLLLVYRTDLIPDPRSMVRLWREECARLGVGNPYLCAVRRVGMQDPAPLGFDALVGFPPNDCVSPEISGAIPGRSAAFRGRIFDYCRIAQDAFRDRHASLPGFPGVMPSWDNTARRRERAHIYDGGTPLRYRAWLAEAMRIAQRHASLPEPLVFINAWNEWAEGCHLEPDTACGDAWLAATRAARTDAAGGDGLWQTYGPRVPALTLDEERRLAGSTLAAVRAAVHAGDARVVAAPLFAQLVAALRRLLDRWPRLTRIAVHAARLVGLAD
jgi:lipopolysaccharide biosynthesis protein